MSLETVFGLNKFVVRKSYDPIWLTSNRLWNLLHTVLFGVFFSGIQRPEYEIKLKYLKYNEIITSE